MQKIKKTINLEDFKTRYPLVYPSIKDSSLSLVNKYTIRLNHNANYGLIPFGVNEAVCGSYSSFTNDMLIYYGGMTLDYMTLEDWYKDFKAYYDLLYDNACGIVYSSATHYWRDKLGSATAYYQTYRQMDIDFTRRGGKKFYEWLSNYYFVHIDLIYEYRMMLDEDYEFEHSYIQWQDIVENVGDGILYYPTVVSMYSTLIERQKMLNGEANCALSEDCCTCGKYKKLGGNDMIAVLKHWLDRNDVLKIDTSDYMSYLKSWLSLINSEIESEDEVKDKIISWIRNTAWSDDSNPYWSIWLRNGHTIKKVETSEEEEWLYMWAGLTHPELSDLDEIIYQYLLDKIQPYASINVSMRRKIADFGNYSIFSSEYNAANEYTSGDVCTYNGIYYYLTGGTGHVYDNVAKQYVFKPSDWITYFDHYRSQEEHKYEFVDYPANYVITGVTQSSLVSFERDTRTIDNTGNALPGYYKPLAASNFMQPLEGTLLDINYEVGQAINTTYLDTNKFAGDVLYEIDLYYNDASGNKIDSSVVQCLEGDNFLDKVAECKKNSVNYGDDIDLTLRADFIYYKGAIYSYNIYTKKLEIENEVIGTSKYVSGIKHVDHCYLVLKTCMYHITATESYPLAYYDVIKNKKEFYSDSMKKYVKAYICDFMFYPVAFQKSKNTSMSWSDMLAAPLFRKEELLGVSMPEKVTDNIYIDRGYATVMDKHLKMGEITSLDALEKYGNGSFNLINTAEDTLNS